MPRSFDISCRMLPQLLELFRDRHMKVSANGYTSSAFTIACDVHLELSKVAFETIGACASKRGGGGDCSEQQPQASRTGVAHQK